MCTIVYSNFFVGSERLALMLSDLGTQVTRSVASLIAASEEKQEVANKEFETKLNFLSKKMTDLETKLESRLVEENDKLSKDVINSVTTMLSETNANPDNIRRQRKKLDTALDTLPQKVDEILQGAKDSLEKSMEDKSTALLEVVSKGNEQLMNRFIDVGIATWKTELKKALDSATIDADNISQSVVNITSTALEKAIADSMHAGVEKTTEFMVNTIQLFTNEIISNVNSAMAQGNFDNFVTFFKFIMKSFLLISILNVNFHLLKGFVRGNIYMRSVTPGNTPDPEGSPSTQGW